MENNNWQISVFIFLAMAGSFFIYSCQSEETSVTPEETSVSPEETSVPPGEAPFTPTQTKTNAKKPDTFTATPDPKTATSEPSPTTIIPSPTTVKPSPSYTPTPSPKTPTLINQSPLNLSLEDKEILVRKGPGVSYDDYGKFEGISSAYFDFQIEDDVGNVWLRLSADQDNSAITSFSMGWIISYDLLSPYSYKKLPIYIPDDAKNGRYCVIAGDGINRRLCPSKECQEDSKNPLLWGECYTFDGRLKNNNWFRVSNTDAEEEPIHTHNWVASKINSTWTLIPKEFFSHYTFCDLDPYLEFIPIITPKPTPKG